MLAAGPFSASALTSSLRLANRSSALFRLICSSSSTCTSQFALGRSLFYSFITAHENMQLCLVLKRGG